MGTYLHAKKSGFTIVELIIVIVVIAILALITILSYNGVRNEATNSALQQSLADVRDKVDLYMATHGGQYPATLADAGITATPTVSYQYTTDPTAKTYTVTASDKPASTRAFYFVSDERSIEAGIAPGHNLMVWDEPAADTVPVVLSTGVTIDTSQYRSSSASIRINTGTVGRSLRISPVSGTAGQTVTVKLWMKTDAGWNGTSGNSKIRFGTSTGALVTACGYAGAKADWTEVTCSRAFDSTNTVYQITVGNDGSSGTIWLDDISVSVK